MTDNVFTKQELMKFEQLVRRHWPRPQGDGLEAIDHDRWPGFRPGSATRR